MFGGASPSLADIAAVTGNKNNGNDGGFGDGNGWWVLIILFALFGGWGNGNGFGNNGGGGGAVPVVGADLQRGFDTEGINRQLSGISNGICNLGYDQLSQMNGINTNIMQTGYGITNAIQQDTIAGMQQSNALQTQLADCCCENRAAIAQVRYDMATDTCAVTTAISQAARDITDNANANYRQLHDELVQSQIDAKNEKIAEQQSLIQSLNLAASQANQNQYLIQQLRPSAIPAYNVPNPYAGCGCNPYGQNCCC